MALEREVAAIAHTIVFKEPGLGVDAEVPDLQDFVESMEARHDQVTTSRIFRTPEVLWKGNTQVHAHAHAHV